MAKTIFKENQRWNRPELVTMIGLLSIMTAYRLFEKLFLVSSAQSEVLLTFGVLAGLLTTLFLVLNIRLRVSISDKEIRFQYYPVHYKKVTVNWSDVEACEIVETPLMAELSGQNAHFCVNERYYSVSGRTGMRLYLKDGSTYFIGTRNPQALTNVINNIEF